MSLSVRQQLLFLHTNEPSPEGKVVAWALYDGALPHDAVTMQSGDEQAPPHATVLDAMRDGWIVLQVPALPKFEPGREYETGHLPYEYVLERRVEIEAG